MLLVIETIAVIFTARWINYKVFAILSQLESFLSREQKLKSAADVPSRFDGSNDIRFFVHMSEHLFKTSLHSTFPRTTALATLLRNKVHQIVPKIAKASWNNKLRLFSFLTLTHLKFIEFRGHVTIEMFIVPDADYD